MPVPSSHHDDSPGHLPLIFKMDFKIDIWVLYNIFFDGLHESQQEP